MSTGSSARGYVQRHEFFFSSGSTDHEDLYQLDFILRVHPEPNKSGLVLFFYICRLNE